MTLESFDADTLQYLYRLKRWWESQGHRQDTHGVCGIDDAIEEASTHLLSLYDRPNETGGVSVLDRKVCRICDRPSRNDPCDECYGDFRTAIDERRERTRCVVCEEPTNSILCPECADLFYRD